MKDCRQLIKEIDYLIIEKLCEIRKISLYMSNCLEAKITPRAEFYRYFANSLSFDIRLIEDKLNEKEELLIKNKMISNHK